MRIDPQQLADREAIRECALRYARGVDRLDADLMKSAYWPDATDDHGRFVGNGWEFAERVVGCQLAEAIGFDAGKDVSL